MKLSGKTAIVTGAGSGINRAIAQAFAAQGAVVLCADQDELAANQTVDTILDAGGTAHAVRCDVTRAEDIEELLDIVTRDGGSPDILVNGAGIMRAQPVLDTTRDSLQAIFDVNVFGLFFMLQSCAKIMIAAGRQGRIINLASIAGRQGNAGSLQYCASKASVISITQSAGQALARHGITVNAIAPGYIQTAMWKQIQGDFRDAVGSDGQAFDQHFASTVAIGRLGAPTDIIGTALFLASDEAAYIVGQTINVDGGITFN